MSRDGLSFLLGAALFLGLAATGAGAPPEDRDSRIATSLAVQRALRVGKDQLQRGNYQAAVDSLESQVARINGDQEYLDALCDAYRGLVRELQQKDRTAELAIYLRRLQILDSGSPPDRDRTSPRAPELPRVASRLGEDKPTAPLLAQLAQVPDPKTRRIVPRGVPAENSRELADVSDPFHPANAKLVVEAKDLLQRAESAYSNGHYDAAGRLFEQANRLDATLVSAAQERWAYCKVHGVADLLNHSKVTDQNANDMEQAVRLAMSMSPKLVAFGKKLLGEIDARKTDSAAHTAAVFIEVHHKASERGWKIAETTNFKVIHRQSQQVAEQVARIAEKTRTAMIRKWFSDDDRAWDRRCDIVLFDAAQDYATSTGVPAGSPGHSTIRREQMSERILSRRIDLHCDNPNMTVGVLPHETTHVVLAGRFGAYDIPRWADEGMAVLAEPRERIDMHLHNLPRHLQERQLFGAAELLRLDNYPDPRRIGPFYAQSVSIVEFLSREKGPRVFTQFLRDGLRSGYEPALGRHYGIHSFHELEACWQRYAFEDGRAAPVQVGRSR